MKTLVFVNETGDAAEILRRGGLAALPTETVYGLSANGLDSKAVKKIYEVKGRPAKKPINLLVSGISMVERFCVFIPKEAYILAEKFWPGPLTMILKKGESVPPIVTAGGGTVGVRQPKHKLTQEIIEKAGFPLATPSANISGMPSPKDVKSVLSYFDGLIDCVVDGGECALGVESTIIDMTSRPFKILRAGGLSAGEIYEKTNIEVITG